MSLGVLGDHQARAVRKLLVKEIKKHLRRFVKTTEMDRECWEYVYQDWKWSLDAHYDDMYRLVQAYEQLGGFAAEVEVKWQH